MSRGSGKGQRMFLKNLAKNFGLVVGIMAAMLVFVLLLTALAKLIDYSLVFGVASILFLVALILTLVESSDV